MRRKAVEVGEFLGAAEIAVGPDDEAGVTCHRVCSGEFRVRPCIWIAASRMRPSSPMDSKTSKRTWLHTNGFGISLRLQADRCSARDEYLWLRRVWHALIMLPI